MSKLTIFDITKQICDAVQARAGKGTNYYYMKCKGGRCSHYRVHMHISIMSVAIIPDDRVF